MSQRLRDFYFRIDLRSLGLFRILFGCVLLHDWLARWPHLAAFYTADGILPREYRAFHFSLLDHATTLPAVQAAFILGLVSYLCFLLGWRTRISHLLTCLFFVSVVNRNPLICNGGDRVLSMMLIWSLFLPLGDRFSIDAVWNAVRRRATLRREEEAPVPTGAKGERRKGKGEKETGEHPSSSPSGALWAVPLSPSISLSAPSAAAFAAVSQIGLIYLLTAIAKDGGTWRQGTALYYILHQEQLLHPLGLWLGGGPLWALKLLTRATYWLELAAAFLILLPFWQPWLRRAAIVGLVGLHTGIWLTMNIGEFSPAMMSAFSLLLLPADWQVLERWARPLRSYGARLAAFSSVGALSHWTRSRVPDVRRQPPRVTPRTSGGKDGGAAPRAGGRSAPWSRCVFVLTNGIVSLLFVLGLVDAYNVYGPPRLGLPEVRIPTALKAVLRYPGNNNSWNMFAPNPSRYSGWLVVEGRRADGRTIDPLTGQEPTWEKPADVSSRHDRYWRKYIDQLKKGKNADHRESLAEYLTRKSHREQPEAERLTVLALYYVRERTPAPGTDGPRVRQYRPLWRRGQAPGAEAGKADSPGPDGGSGSDTGAESLTPGTQEPGDEP
jgi:hypothetical protein